MDRLWIVLVGGLLPAFAFGRAAVVQKGAMLNGIGPGSYMVYNGIVFVAAGLLLRPVLGEPLLIASGWPLALAGGLCFAVATGAISFAVQRMGAPISLLAPITVISTLVTVVLGFLIFREHESAVALKLLGGASLIVAGAALVATS
jgi:drug/metabolite transporter (DMT)-like permease